jgi:hypothetical protein
MTGGQIKEVEMGWKGRTCGKKDIFYSVWTGEDAGKGHIETYAWPGRKY